MFFSILLGLKKSSEDCVSRPLAKVFGLHTASVLSTLDRRFFAAASSKQDVRWIRIKIKELAKTCLISEDTCGKILTLLEYCGIIERRQTDINTYFFCLFPDRFTQIKKIIDSSEYPDKTWAIFSSKLRFKLIGDSSGKGRNYSEAVLQNCLPIVDKLFDLIETQPSNKTGHESINLDCDRDNLDSVKDIVDTEFQIVDTETAIYNTFNKDPNKDLNKINNNISLSKNAHTREREENINFLIEDSKEENQEFKDISYLVDTSEDCKENQEHILKIRSFGGATSTNKLSDSLLPLEDVKKDLMKEHPTKAVKALKSTLNPSQIWKTEDEAIAFDQELTIYAQKRAKTNAIAYKAKILESIVKTAKMGLVHPLLQEFRDGRTIGRSDLKPWHQEDGKLDDGFHQWLKRKYSENNRDGSIAIDRLSVGQLGQKWDEYKRVVLLEIESAMKLKKLGVGYVSISPDVLPALEAPSDREFELLKKGSGFFPSSKNQETKMLTDCDKQVKTVEVLLETNHSDRILDADIVTSQENDSDPAIFDGDLVKNDENDANMQRSSFPLSEAAEKAKAKYYSLFPEILEKMSFSKKAKKSMSNTFLYDAIAIEKELNNGGVTEDDYYCDDILGF